MSVVPVVSRYNAMADYSCRSVLQRKAIKWYFKNILIATVIMLRARVKFELRVAYAQFAEYPLNACNPKQPLSSLLALREKDYSY